MANNEQNKRSYINKRSQYKCMYVVCLNERTPLVMVNLPDLASWQVVHCFITIPSIYKCLQK